MPSPDSADLRAEIAATAARLIADGGLDYASAKRKAARSVLGREGSRNAIPDNETVDRALLDHLSLFDDDHDARVARRRAVALALMEMLAEFNPMLTGAVWKGIVAEHSPIHLMSFSDNAKEMAIALLNHGIEYDAVMLPHFKGSGEVEALAFWWRGEPVILSAYDERDQRSGPRTGPRDGGDRAALAALLAA